MILVSFACDAACSHFVVASVAMRPVNAAWMLSAVAALKVLNNIAGMFFSKV